MRIMEKEKVIMDKMIMMESRVNKKNIRVIMMSSKS